MKIFVKGDDVPEWLITQAPTSYDSQKAKIKFLDNCVVWVSGEDYRIAHLNTNTGAVIHVESGRSLDLQCHSPNGLGCLVFRPIS